MNYKKRFEIMLAFFIVLIFVSNSMMIVIGHNQSTLQDKSLPPAQDVSMMVETAIFRRMSVREFTTEPVSDTDLATVLWAAYGLNGEGSYTISAINNSHAAVIYVFTEEAVYTYDSLNHSLKLFKNGDHRNDINILQYEAPVQLGLCWNTSKANPNQAGVELGQIGQNIQFMANALGLGTVVTGQIPPAIEPVNIPDDQKGMIIMPLGHPKNDYNFIQRPMWISSLPKVQISSMSLSDALKNIKEQNDCSKKLSDQQFSQVIWSTYGFSLLLDKSNQEPIHLKRHRTVPSAHGYYPLIIYVATENGVYQYYPNVLIDILQLISAPVDRFGLPIVSFLKKIGENDIRSDLGMLCENDNVSTASLVLIPVLDLDKAKELSGESARRFWYYEAGAAVQNVMLESAAWNLSSNIIYPIPSSQVRSYLDINSNQIPQLMVTVGSK